jgi:hypothetical protein
MPPTLAVLLYPQIPTYISVSGKQERSISAVHCDGYIREFFNYGNGNLKTIYLYWQAGAKKQLGNQ